MKRMSEHELELAVVEVARLLRWRVAHFRAARSGRGWRTPVAYDAQGWPDLTLVGHGRLLVRELKVGRGEPTPEQAEWLAALRAAGVDAGVWREADWHAGRIEAELRAKEGRVEQPLSIRA